MKGRIVNKLGEVSISEDVISTLAGAVAVECFGVVGMASVSMRDGFVKMLKRESLQKGIEVDIEDNEISIGLHIVVAYGVSISAVAENLRNDVRYRVEEYTGMNVKNVQIFVEAVKPID